MAITYVLHYQKSLFEHKGLRNINSDSWKTPNLAWPTFARKVPTLEPASQNLLTVNFLCSGRVLQFVEQGLKIVVKLLEKSE